MKMKKLIQQIGDFFDTLKAEENHGLVEKQDELKKKLEKKISAKKHKLKSCKDKYKKKELQKEIKVLKKLAQNFQEKRES